MVNNMVGLVFIGDNDKPHGNIAKTTATNPQKNYFLVPVAQKGQGKK